MTRRDVIRAPLPRPRGPELLDVAQQVDLELTLDEAEDLSRVVEELLGIVDQLNGLPEAGRPAAAPHTPRWAGRRPTAAENPFNSFIRLCDVSERDAGPLRGRTLGLKDNIDVAGIETTNGSSMTPYVAVCDAVVVERILAAGGRIVGKLNMDGWSAGGSGETSAFGIPRNPVNPRHTPGGSSGGSSAAVRCGAVDLALGVDQAGSARMPASYCGVVAIKATQGVVPTFGVTHHDHTLDAVCPMARTVSEAELLLTVIAGADWRDPACQLAAFRGSAREETRWHINRVRIDEGSPRPLAGLRVGLVAEGSPESMTAPDVVANQDAVATVLRDAGAEVTVTSVPLWEWGYRIARVLLCHLVDGMISSEGEGYGHLGLIDADRMDAFARVRRAEGREFPPLMKVWMITGRYLHAASGNASYALVQNLRLELTRQIHARLTEFDLLVTPTTPIPAPELADGPLAGTDLVARTAPASPHNTAPANLSGHPALAVPTGEDRSGLPLSSQLVGPYLAEPMLCSVGRILERQLGPTFRDDDIRARRDEILAAVGAGRNGG
jgi:amidase